ncbi:probable tRNA (uracil-O(2)-)-methyltransferase [Ixodes scapularis]|uniref:probable tRNA (uracil-O(2)-)-methyltransferase n=1 Tax=Ixodes scapularis TaxID=6945 RepID=UPI001A9F1AEC|nr:probable tRNA (uracil-O(2)-)-methyltransferase [Ixodes scapularis]
MLCLQEQAITPEVRLPEYSWWIGNHSDELTPWIPYLASRSRPDARVFLLPCCPFGFHGKYQRQHGNMSQYQSYLLFLQDLCRGLRFSVQLDRLRIPSTKRICLVCKPGDAAGDTGLGAESPTAWKSVPDRIRWPSADSGESRTETAGDTNDGHGTGGFKPREGVEAVRNCTQLDRRFLDSTVDLIAKRLLQAEATDGEALPDRDHWNRGGVMHLRDLVQLLTEQDLQMLKSQCGGLQTLIRNHRHIFLVEKGLVSLNVPSSETQRRIQSKSGPASKCPPRKKQCWFFAHHPQGCPLTSDSCHFLHRA